MSILLHKTLYYIAHKNEPKTLFDILPESIQQKYALYPRHHQESPWYSTDVDEEYCPLSHWGTYPPYPYEDHPHFALWRKRMNRVCEMINGHMPLAMCSLPIGCYLYKAKNATQETLRIHWFEEERSFNGCWAGCTFAGGMWEIARHKMDQRIQRLRLKVLGTKMQKSWKRSMEEQAEEQQEEEKRTRKYRKMRKYVQ